MRKFKITDPTVLKLGTTEQSSSLSPTQFLKTEKGTILEVGDFIADAGNGHLKLTIMVNVYGDHIEEITSDLVVSTEQASAIYAKKLNDKQFKDLNDCLVRFNITTPERVRHFLSQTAHESGCLEWLTEIGDRNYFKKYEGRKDLGNVYQGDGYLYRGAGAIQLTGRYNYQQFADYMKDPVIMQKGADYIAEKYPFMSAGFWWNKNGMNQLIDKGVTVKEVTKKVNGGYNGLQDRIRYYLKAKDVI